nr:hypothetical protein [Tanacetum cinerariifolium]
MSRDVLTVGSTMRIPLLYRGEYSQWVERFMNYLEEQMDGEAMINSIKNGDQPLPRVTQVSIAGTSSTEQPPLKDKSMWSDQEKRIQKVDHLARSLLIQGLPNDIYSLIDSNKTNKNLTNINIDALYNILKQNQGDVNDAMGSKKRTIVVTSNPLALIAEKTEVRKSKEKVVVSSDSEGSEADDFSELKKITALLAKAFNQRKVKCYNCKKEGHFTKDCKKVKVKDYEYYKTKMLLAKKDKDEHVLLAEDQAWMESSSDSDQEINENMVFMAQIKKVLSDSEASSSSANENISETLLVVLEDLRIPVLFGRRKGSSNTSNVALSAVSDLNLNKNVKRYPRKELLACNNSHLGETSSAYMCNVGNKMHKAFPLPVIEFPLEEEVPTASEESCHYQKKREATAVKIALLSKSKRNFPASAASAETIDTASDGTSKKKGRTVTVTVNDMQRRKNDVKERTTLLMSLPDEYQL